MSFQLVEGDVVLYDSSGNPLAYADDDDVSSAKGLLIAAKDSQSKARILAADSGDNNLLVASRLQGPPQGTTEFVLAQDDTYLEVGPSPTYRETVSDAVADGADLYIQCIAGGAQGDPSENGSKVEVYWREGATPTDHLIERIYLTGSTVCVHLPNTHSARDGTELTGDGTTTKVVIRRERLSTSGQEIDAVVRGFTE